VSNALKDSLARWESAGLIDARQAQAIADFEARSAPAPTAGAGSITATEVITYAGALVTLAGLGTLLGTQYRQLGVIGRLAIPGLVAVAALAVAWILPGERARARRAQTSLVTLAIVAIALFVGQLQVELVGGPTASISTDTGTRIALVSALIAAVLAAALLSRLRAGLLAAELSISVLIAAGYSVVQLHLDRGWPTETVFLVAAVLLLLAAEYGRSLHVLWATEVLASLAAWRRSSLPSLPRVTATCPLNSLAVCLPRRPLRRPSSGAARGMRSQAASDCLRLCSTSSSATSEAALALRSAW
jgi:hypothetical protein